MSHLIQLIAEFDELDKYSGESYKNTASNFKF